MKGLVHEARVNQTDEWYTPRWIFDRLGLEFDLDPCAPPNGVPWVPARRTIDANENGLLADWEGRVWLNPPYSNAAPFLRRMVEHGRGVVLIFSRTDTKAFQHAAAAADAVAFTRGRIAFVDMAGNERRGAGAGSAILAFGGEEADAVAQADFGLTFRKPE